MKGLVNFCWFFFKWGTIVAIVAALAAAPSYYRHIFGGVDEVVRARVETKIADHFPELAVRVSSAHLTSDGICVRGLWIGERAATGPQAELAHIEEILLACNTSLKELIGGEPLITSVTVKRPTVRATRRPDGTFSLSKLLAIPKCRQAPPRTTIENGTIEVFDPLKVPSSTFTLREINLRLQPADSPLDDPLLAIEGWLAADHVQRIELTGTLRPLGKQWTLAGTVDGLEISPELRNSLPQPLAEPLEAIKALRAPASLSFTASCDDPGKTPRYEVNGQLTRGRFDDPQVNLPLTDVECRFHCENSGVTISEVSMRHGHAIWEVPHLQFTPGSPIELQASGKHVRLDRALGASLPEPWRRNFQNYDPQGEVNVRCTLRFEAGSWKPVLGRVDAVSNVSFSYYKFPYRLENAAGSLTLRNGMLYVELTADSGTQPIVMSGQFLNPGPNFTGFIDIRGKRMPFDEKLCTALLPKPKSHETIRALDPRGTFDFYTRIWREDPKNPLVHQQATIDLNGCSLKYEKFPYPLSNVRGRLEVTDGHWTMPNKLTGANGAGQIVCGGELQLAPARDDALRVAAGKDELWLTFEGKGVPLTDDLKRALRPAEQQLWDSLRPRGNVDFLAHVHYDSISKQTGIDLNVSPRGDATSIGTSIEPVAFPYRMENLKGSVHYHNNRVEIKRLQADHRNTTMCTDGWCDFGGDGQWRLHLEKLEVNKLRLRGEDQDLLVAMPESLRRAVNELQLNGPVNVCGSVDFSKAGAGQPLDAGWNVDCYLHQASVQAGSKIENISGRVRFNGASHGAQVASQGYLDLDSVTYKNFQLTQVLGPLSFNNEFVYLGAMPNPTPGQPPRQITANVLGGIVTGECKVTLGSLPVYDLLVSVTGADLAQFARENIGRQKLTGKVQVQADLHGSRGVHSLNGSGHIRLTEADVYKLPAMLSLLKIAGGKPPSDTAFTNSDIDFQVRGEHVTLSHVELNGDAISLSGMGELTLDGQTNPIRLELHTAVGNPQMPILSSVMRMASEQIMKIYVDGPLDSPQVRKDPFPGVAQAFGGPRVEPERLPSTQPTAKPSPGIFPRR